MITDEIQTNLAPLQGDYTKVTGSPFAHFFCPLLCRDEDVELCMGHIISKTWKNCCRATVVQRGDIDHWYGSIAEADFGTLLDVRAAGLHGVVRDEKLLKQVKPKILVEGQECHFYLYQQGKSSPHHTHIELVPGPGDDIVRLVLKKHPSQMVEDRGKRWSIVVDRDWRPPVIVSVIKAAYLTLVKMLGYGYALSPGGLEIGRYTLGKFFKENNGKPRNEVREAIPKFFQPYRHIIRPVGEFGGLAPRGTIEDNTVGICFGSSGRPWAMIVFVRIDQDVFAVLMPAFNHIDSLDAYRSFREEDADRRLNVLEAVFEPQQGRWEACENPFRAFWPKQSATFDLDRQVRPS
jgi:hypothetical protein